MKKSIGLAAMLPGFLSLNVDAIPEKDRQSEKLDLLDVIIAPLNTQTPIYLAGHRSHSSHASHGSHRSSSSGGYSSAPKRISPPSDPLGRPATPSMTIPKTPSISSKIKIENRVIVIKRVQAILMVHDYYMGAIDGVMGPQTRSAILNYRQANNLGKSTEIDSILLNSLGIMAQ